MTRISKRLNMHLESEYDNKDVIGFIIIYFIVVLIIPYILFHYASFTVFVTYFANIDIFLMFWLLIFLIILLNGIQFIIIH